MKKTIFLITALLLVPSFSLTIVHAEQSQLKNELNKSSGDTKIIKKHKTAIKKSASTNYFETGEGLLLAGKYKEAMDYFNKLIKLNHKDSSAYLGRARTYKEIGDYKNALKDFNQSINLNLQNGEAYYYRGIFYVIIEENRKAISDLNKAIDLSKDLNIKQGSLYSRGLLYDDLGEYQKAIVDFDKCIELDKNYSEGSLLLGWSANAYEGRANVFFHLGNYKQAIKEFDKVIELNPRRFDGYSMRGLAYSKAGNPQRAIIDYAKALEIVENNERTYRDIYEKEGWAPYKSTPNADVYRIYTRRASAYKDIGDINRAIADYTNAIDYDPTKSDAYFLRGYTYGINGDKGKSIEDFKVAARLGDKASQDFLRKQEIEW